MNSRQLEYVLAVSETMSFSEAAKQLYVSQPSLSQYVKKVEAEIGAEIFVRTTPLKLTYEGEIFVRYAKTVLNEEKQLALEMADINENRGGELKIGAGPLNSSVILPSILSPIINQYPGIQINITEAGETELMELLETGEVDIVLTVMSVQSSDARVVEEVAREQYVLVVPIALDVSTREYPNKTMKSPEELPTIPISEYKELPYIMQRQSMPANIIFEDLCRSNGFMPQTKVICKNVNTAVQLAKRGIGACFIPFSVVTELPQKYFHCYRIEGNKADRVIKTVYRKSMKLTIIQQDVLARIRNFYQA